MGNRPDPADIDRLVETLDGCLAQYERAMGVLGWTMLNANCRAALSDLAAHARERSRAYEHAASLTDEQILRATTAEADRDRLREQLAHEQRAADAESDELTRQAHEARADRDRLRVEVERLTVLAAEKGHREERLARRVAELEHQATQDGATILLREAERDEAEGKYVAEIVRHTRTEGRVAELEAALRDTLQEIDELGTEYTALRKKHEPPYIVYIPWSRPGVLRVLGTTTGPEPPEEKMRRYMEGDPKRAGDGGGA